MIYLRLREVTTSRPGQAMRLGEVADVLADASLNLQELPVRTPRSVGIWKLDALLLIREVQARCPGETVVLLGSAQGTLVCERPKGTGGKGLRAALVFALLFVGSAMAIAWFHADVNMGMAQSSMARILTGREQWNPWWIALPYALGVGSGVAFYYALIGRKTPSPLDIKLDEYRKQARGHMARPQTAEGGGKGENNTDG